jgi:hypothetical protein
MPIPSYLLFPSAGGLLHDLQALRYGQNSLEHPPNLGLLFTAQVHMKELKTGKF